MPVIGLRSRLIHYFFSCVLFFGALPVMAAPIDELKAAYLLNFAKFTTWPADVFQTPGDPVIFCGFDNEPVIEALRALGERRVDNRIVRVRVIKGMQDNAGCHVLYAGQLPLAAGKQEFIRRRGLLVVGDGEHLLREGGTINYFLQQGMLRFEISVENARAAELVLSARLLNLAKRREEGP